MQSVRVQCPPDGAVSPVVGFVLVLGIAIGTMTLVFLWGAPTLESVTASQTAAAAEREFTTLAAEVEALMAGAPVSTTPQWSPTLSRGALHIADTGSTWAILVPIDNEPDPTVEFRLKDITDGDHLFTLRNEAGDSVTQLGINAWAWNGNARSTVFALGAGCAALPSTFGPGDQADLGVYTTSLCTTPVRLEGGSWEFELYDTATPARILARLSVMDTGRVRWDMPTTGIRYEEEYHNGAVLSGQNGLSSFTKAPIISPPRLEASGTTSLFIRLLRVDNVGGASAVPGGSITYLLENGGSYVRFSVEDGVMAQIYPPLDEEDVWADFFTDPSGEYGFEKETTPDLFIVAKAGTDVFKVSVAHSTVTMELGGDV